MRLARLMAAAALPGAVLASQAQERATTQPPTPEQRLASWSTTRAGQDIRAQLAFGRVVADAQVEQLAQRHGVRVTAVYMYADGQFGAHHVAPAQATPNVGALARQATTQLKSKSLTGNAVRAREFARLHSAAQVAADPRLTSRARSLLAIREQGERIANRLGRGEPIIYAIEVIGPVEAVRRAGADQLVRGFEPAVIVDGRPIVPDHPRPADLRSGRAPSAIDALPAATAHARLDSIGRTAPAPRAAPPQ